MEQLRDALLSKVAEWKQNEMYDRRTQQSSMDVACGDIVLQLSVTRTQRAFVGTWGHAALVTRPFDYDPNAVFIEHCVYPRCEQGMLLRAGDGDGKATTTTTGARQHRFVRLRANEFLSQASVDLYRYSAVILAGYLISKGTNYGGICALLTSKCWASDSRAVVSATAERWRDLLESDGDIQELICSSMVLLAYQLVFYLFDPTMLVRCLNVNPKGCRPNAAMDLVNKYPAYWELVPDTISMTPYSLG